MLAGWLSDIFTAAAAADALPSLLLGAAISICQRLRPRRRLELPRQSVGRCLSWPDACFSVCPSSRRGLASSSGCLAWAALAEALTRDVPSSEGWATRESILVRAGARTNTTSSSLLHGLGAISTWTRQSRLVAANLHAHFFSSKMPTLRKIAFKIKR